GYIIAVASGLGGANALAAPGCPINFNFLIGDEYIKIAANGGLGHQANLGAEAFSALNGVTGSATSGCDAASNMAVLSFDGTSGYNRLPRTLALDHFQNQSDENNNTLLIVNRIGGNMALSGLTIGPLFALFYDDAEQPFSVT